MATTLRGEKYEAVQGTAVATNADADEAVIAAPGAGKRLCITKAYIMVYLAQSGATDGVVALEDGVGGTRIAALAGVDSAKEFALDFGEYGYPLTENTALNLTTVGSGTLASVRCTAVGYIRKV